MQANKFIEVQNLSKRFTSGGKILTVFSQLNFELAEGQFASFVGPSGCGKSTLMRVVASLLVHDIGSITIGGESPKALTQQKKIGFAFQEPGLIEWRTVFNNILLPAEIGKSAKPSADIINRAEELLVMMGLQDFKNYHPHQLSGGMKQRVGLARALLLQPSLLILDEPFSSLDGLTKLKLTVEFQRILKEQNTTVLSITHSIDEAAYMADRIFIMKPLPSTIVKTIDVTYTHPRNIDLFNQAEFGAMVAQCRKYLLQNEVEN